MIIDSIEHFVSHLQDNWMGKEVAVTKTNLLPVMEVKLNEVKLSSSREVDRRIQEKHAQNSHFLVLAVEDVGEDAVKWASLRKSLVIHVDGRTVFDVRDQRLVLLSDEEVVQFKLLEKKQDGKTLTEQGGGFR